MSDQMNASRSGAPIGSAGIDAETAGARNAPLQPMQSTQLDDWLTIAPDGTITIFSEKVELVTGVPTE